MENKQQQCSTQFVLTIVYLNNILFHAEFSAMDYTLNIKKKRQYSNIRGLREGPGKFFMGVLEKSWIFLSVKEWEPCVYQQLANTCSSRV